MKIFLVVAILLIFSFTSQAKDRNLLSTARAKSAVISGTLAPASLSFNGQEIEQSDESYEALLLNGEEVSITKAGGLKTFYVTIDKSFIDLKWKKSNGETKPILKIEYPVITDMQLIQNDIFFKFSALTTNAKLDSQNIKIVDSTSSFPVENLKQWLGDVHTIELASAQKSSQIYNLDFQDLRADLLTNKTWTLYQGQAPFYSNASVDAIGLGYRIQNENLRSWEFIIFFGKMTYIQCCYSFNGGPAANDVDQSALEFKTRYGTDPFFTNYGDFNYKRLTIGLQGEVFNYKRKSTFQANFDGYNSDNVDQWFYSVGPFFKWEPLQYNSFGLSFSFDFNLIRSNFDSISDRVTNYFGLSYTY